MPFTFSHPAIILPFKYLPGKWFSFTALVIGSLTPDFEYFIRMKVQSNYSHTIYGIFWFDLPLAIFLSFIFHNLIRNDLFLNSPKFIKSRVSIFNSFNWNNYFKENWIIVIVSALIGIATHIFWDGFTHNHGYFTEHISYLRNDILIFKNTIPIWKIAQHLSTLIGAIFIIFSFMKIPENTIQVSVVNKKYWIAIGTITLLISILRFSNDLKILSIGNLVVTAIAAFLISFAITPIVIKPKVSQKI
jgi:hypothetical protein